MIEISKLNKYYKVGKGKMHALKDIDLTIKDGESLAIQGKSGAGKNLRLCILWGFLIAMTAEVLKLTDRKLKA